MGIGYGADVRTTGCFVLGSGPSLNAVEIGLLARADTISFNRSYLAWKEWGFAPTYYACFDPVVLEDNLPEIRALAREYPATSFFLRQAAGLPSRDNIQPIELVPGDLFSNDLLRLCDFGNVAASSMQLLARLGHRRVVLLGIDARYRPLDPCPQQVDPDGYVLLEYDANHFSPDYARGKRVNPHPDLAKILGRWPQVASECARNGIDVRNASPGSALACFVMMDFASARAWVSNGVAPPKADDGCPIRPAEG